MNTHGRPDTIAELQALTYDLLPFGILGTTATVPGSPSMTIPAFATRAYVRDDPGGALIYVDQPARSLTLTGADGPYWLGIHRDTHSAVSLWSRAPGSHYLWRASPTIPPDPAGGIVFCAVTIAGGQITAVTPIEAVNGVPRIWRNLLNLGTLALQNADALAVTGGSATLGTLTVTGQTRLAVPMAINTVPQSNISLRFHYQKSGMAAGLWLQPTENDAAGTPAILFTNVAGSSVGGIVTSATATAYNTTSDRRLKTAFTALTDGLATVRALRPWRFRWRATGELGTGFVAEEVQPLVPQAVTGIPGAVDAQGQVVPMGLDASKLLPHLVAAVQELAQQVQALTARLAALETP